MSMAEGDRSASRSVTVMCTPWQSSPSNLEVSGVNSIGVNSSPGRLADSFDGRRQLRLRPSAAVRDLPQHQ